MNDIVAIGDNKGQDLITPQSLKSDTRANILQDRVQEKVCLPFPRKKTIAIRDYQGSSYASPAC